MKNILIFAGGTGSIALQTGLHQLYDSTLNIDIIISAYDNGKSTGECRKIFNGKILGPSDLRKNQLTQFKLLHNIHCDSGLNDKNIIYDLFEERYTRIKWEDSYNYAVDRTKNAFARIRELGFGSFEYDKKEAVLLKLIDHFYYNEYISMDKHVRKTILTANLSDFSISNIFYSAAASLNGNSLALAGQLMAEILEIPNNVHLISDVNLYLYAETVNGSVISDEGIIVSYDNIDDPIKKVLLLDEKGKQYIPNIDENNQLNTSCIDLIENADVIIFSSGTQWSSLIPIYMHSGLNEKLKHSKAAKYLIMNNSQDRDMKGINASKLLDIVSNYLDLTDVKIILNINADASMACIDSKWNNQVLVDVLSEKGSKIHDPSKLSKLIMYDYYKEHLDATFYFFDFDDTIWSSSKEPLLRKVSKNNIELIYRCFVHNSVIISGNSVNHFVNLESKFKEAQEKVEINTEDGILIYCNGGNCVYQMQNGVLYYLRNILDDFNLNDDYYILTENLFAELKKGGWELNLSNFENRGNCILSIKPLLNREKAKKVIDKVIATHFTLADGKVKYHSYINGNTTIDIMNSDYNKKICTQYVAENKRLLASQIVYVGDKTEDGNDSCIKELDFTVLSVKDVVEFNSFARTYLYFHS